MASWYAAQQKVWVLPLPVQLDSNSGELPSGVSPLLILYNHGNLLLESVFANGSTYMYLHGKGCPSQKAFFVNNPSSVSPLDPVQEIPCCTVWWWWLGVALWAKFRILKCSESQLQNLCPWKMTHLTRTGYQRCGRSSTRATSTLPGRLLVSAWTWVSMPTAGSKRTQQTIASSGGCLLSRLHWSVPKCCVFENLLHYSLPLWMFYVPDCSKM